MSINLEKRTQQVGIILAKRGLPVAPKTRVGVALDVSGSAKHFYENGVIQETLDRLLAVAMKFDDDGNLDAWTFDNSVGEIPTITESDEGTYVKNKLLKSRVSLWGGTSYAPPLQKAMDFYFGEQAKPASGGFLSKLFGSKPAAPAAATSQEPAMLLFITDGANGDEDRAAAVLREAAKSKTPVYFNMIGVGPANYFGFIQRMADELPNVGFVSMTSLSISDEQLFEAVVSEEFCEWAKKL